MLALLLAGFVHPSGEALPGEVRSGTDARASGPSEGKLVTPPASDSLGLHLELPDEVEAAAPVPITLQVKNRSDRPVDLYLTGRPIAFDLVVTDEGGGVVWRRLEGEYIAMTLRIETLAPGDSLELSDTWDQRTRAGDPVPPGVYGVRGEVLTEDEPLVTPTRSLRILP